jgi:crossover junction endodeoxyribonuclease RuvC
VNTHAPLTKKQYILGIDPGLSGGYAVIDGEGTFITCGAFPTHVIKKSGKKSTQLDGVSLADELDLYKGALHAFIETVSSRPRQQGQFQFGVNVGMLHGMLYAMRVPFTGVSPASWKMNFGIKRLESETKAQKKSEARAIASKFYPKHADKFKRVKDDGVAEATLIALYGLSTLIF